MTLAPLPPECRIRRRRLDVPGTEDARIVRAAWLRFPELRMESPEQTYAAEAERVYRCRATVDGEPFTARLDIDEYGRVLQYEGLRVAQ